MSVLDWVLAIALGLLLVPTAAMIIWLVIESVLDYWHDRKK